MMPMFFSRWYGQNFLFTKEHINVLFMIVISSATQKQKHSLMNLSFLFPIIAGLFMRDKVIQFIDNFLKAICDGILYKYTL